MLGFDPFDLDSNSSKTIRGDSMSYITYCKHESILGGDSYCRKYSEFINSSLINEDDRPYCCYCKYAEDSIEYIEEKSHWDLWDYNTKPKWNEPRKRCIEGIPVDKKIPKTHMDEHDYKMYWHEEYKEMMIKWFGAIHCIKHGII